MMCASVRDKKITVLDVVSYYVVDFKGGSLNVYL